MISPGLFIILTTKRGFTKMKLSILNEKLSIVRLKPNQPIPNWSLKSTEFLSISLTEEELSIVCSESSLPSKKEDLEVNDGWRCIKVEGPLDFSLTGILSKLAAPLAEANISIFAVSTYDTDYLMVKNDDLNKATEVLTNAGNEFQ